jgi:LAO/AO transport system kinase
LSKAQQLAVDILKGNRKAIAKAITLAESNSTEGHKLASLLYSHTGDAHIIGITGPGGVGKSTLVEKLAKEIRNRGKSVGIIAVDPTSPFSGGAFLGDRIRMQGLSLDEGVFIRSMATRNNPGGLARATKETVRILDASGKDVVIVETVGAGQSEVNVIGIAQTIVVVLAPGFGDEIQAIKAGMMEIGDIFVINKSDQENADRAVIDIQAMLGLSDKKRKWNPPIIKTIATTGDGTLQLLEKINEHRKYLEKNGDSLRQKTLIEMEVIEAIKQKTTEHILHSLRKSGRLSSIVASILAKEVDPLTAAEKVVQDQMRLANPE